MERHDHDHDYDQIGLMWANDCAQNTRIPDVHVKEPHARESSLLVFSSVILLFSPN